MNQAQPNPFPFPLEFIWLFLGILCAVLLVSLVVQIFYLLTLQKALSRVSPRNRSMEPGHVWLMFIPCLNIVWGFLIAIRVPDSLKNEFADRRRDDGSDYGKTIGLAYCILSLVGNSIGSGIQQIPDLQILGVGISVFVAVITLALWIVFWVKIANYSKMLEQDDDGRYRDFDRRFGDDDDDDFDDARGSPRAGGAGPTSDAIKEGDPGAYQK
jgi:uncharacterized membrane protein